MAQAGVMRCHVDERALKHIHSNQRTGKLGLLRKGGGGWEGGIEGYIPVIDINGFTSPELTF